MRQVFLFFFLTVTLLAAWMFSKSGFWKEVTISEDEVGPWNGLYLEHLGPYHGVSKIFQNIEEDSKTKGFPCNESFGLYLDDPRVVDHERLRSHLGCLWRQENPSINPTGYKLFFWPKQKVVQAQFKGSPALGPLKVYKEVFSYAEKRGIRLKKEVLEIYTRGQETNDITTTYVFTSAE